MAGSEEIHNYLEVAKKLALECGEIFESALALGKRVDTKSSDYDLVTEYDRAIEALLIEGLSSKFPEHKFIAEESTAAANEMSALTDSPTWLIDPIDGTTNFVHGFSQCCISMGLTVKKRLVLGLIYNPSSNEMFTAIRGEGAFLNGKRMNTSKITELNKSLVYIEPMGIRQSGKNRDIAVARFEAFVCSTQGIRSFGSAALGLAYVARGTLDALHLDHVGPWDVAAGALLVEEAGGVVIDPKGGPHDLMNPKTIAAATEKLARDISKMVVDTDLITQRKRLTRVPSSTKLL
ncbi:inositol monophosphatase 2-like isoform X1 [Venturia canescens]|uniref:inositol monophosphatase 2-like isoform X1 n=1 Tax=Venturia canescens TaxID=32260 RepID=UPI001C9C2B4B|nr:inositol monophosphatase 2-like isoform X1 [Venturia canescens]